jgi:ATP-dependent RNA helicase DHX8/PRP22
MDRYKLELGSAGRDYKRICKAVASGYFFHAARKDAQDGYKSLVRTFFQLAVEPRCIYCM